MQLLVKGVDACTHVVQADEDEATVWNVKQQLQVRVRLAPGAEGHGCEAEP
jgi:hypothetical protein